MKKIFILLTMLWFSLASAQLNTQSIIVSPVSDFTVDVHVDKDYTGNATPSYAIGENIRISVRPNKSSYIYLYDVDAAGRITQLLPNRLAGGKNNYVHAGEVRSFPMTGSSFSFTVGGPQGIDRVVAIASRTPLNTGQLVQFSQGNFARSSLSIEAFAQRLSIIVNPLPHGQWVADTAQFLVQQSQVFVPQPSPTIPPVYVSPHVPPITPQPPVVPATYTLSHCAGLHVPALATVETIHNSTYSSTATLYTAYGVYDIYQSLLTQLESRGFYEAFRDNYGSHNYLDALLVTNHQQINITLEETSFNNRIHVTVSCTQ